jgi:serine protease Do
MTERPTDLSSLPSYRAPRRSLFSARKFALMASVVAGLGVAVYGFGPPSGPLNVLSSPAQAQVNNEVRKVAQPVGFADIVERVKPSVISVKVNINEKVAKDDSGDDDTPSFQPGSPMERFFRRFGGPDGLPPGLRGGKGRVITGQGSGFFISADGFAVTNNHVVDGASKVEVTTDEGKTFTAQVIGTDARTDLALIKVEGSSNFPFAKLSDTKPRIGDWVLAVGNPALAAR